MPRQREMSERAGIFAGGGWLRGKEVFQPNDTLRYVPRAAGRRGWLELSERVGWRMIRR